MAKKTVMILSVILIILGILGFFWNPILGIFSVNALHNIIFLVSGLLGWYASSKGEDSARMFARIFGIIYAIVMLLGFLAPGFMVPLVNTNTADSVLHLIFAAILLYSGYMGGKAMSAPTGGMQM